MQTLVTIVFFGGGCSIRVDGVHAGHFGGSFDALRSIDARAPGDWGDKRDALVCGAMGIHHPASGHSDFRPPVMAHPFGDPSSREAVEERAAEIRRAEIRRGADFETFRFAALACLSNAREPMGSLPDLTRRSLIYGARVYAACARGYLEQWRLSAP